MSIAVPGCAFVNRLSSFRSALVRVDGDLAEGAVIGNRMPHRLDWGRHSVDMLGGGEGEVNEDTAGVMVQLNLRGRTSYPPLDLRGQE